MQNFNLQLSIYNLDNIMLYIIRSQQLNKAKKITKIRLAYKIRY